VKPKVLLLLLILIAIALVVYLLVRPKPATAPTNGGNANSAQNAQGFYLAELLALQRSRDDKRLADIRTIQSALEAYRGENANGAYPASIAELAATYLSVAVNDPKTGQPYEYTTVGDDRSSYTLTFFLEAGVQGFVPGRHVASPSGITP
jgi:hypothetical protein